MIKKYSLLLLVCLLFLASCKKDEAPKLTVSDLIKGPWKKVSDEKTTYDSSGRVVGEGHFSGPYVSAYNFDGAKYEKLTTAGIETGSYAIVHAKGKDYVVFSSGAGEEQWEIVTISAYKLYLVREYEEAPGTKLRTVLVQGFNRF